VTAVVAPPVLIVHVMKTGGTTLFDHLRDRYGDALWPNGELDLRFDGPRLDIRHHLSLRYLANLPEERRRHIQVYMAHLPYAAREVLPAGTRVVSVLRDPVERTISLLRQFRRRPPWQSSDARRPTLADATLEEVYDHPAVFGPLILNHQTKIFAMRPTAGEASYLDPVDLDHSDLEVAKAHLAALDVVGVMERYDDFLDALEEVFGWRVDRSARANATPAEDVGPVDDALRQRILADNALDVALYEYAGELVDLRRRRRARA
jgi:hypothetical protein